MTVIKPASFAHVVRVPGVVGGEPTIAGTRIPVRSIVLTWRYNPDVEYLCQAFPRLTPALVREALAYYDAHSEEIERYIAENEADLD